MWLKICFALLFSIVSTFYLFYWLIMGNVMHLPNYLLFVFSFFGGLCYEANCNVRDVS